MALTQITVKTKITASTLNGIIDAVNSLQTATPNVYVTETYASGTTGYRKWSNGFIEQWGQLHGASYQVTFPIAMSDTSYYINSFVTCNNGGATSHAMIIHNSKTATGVQLHLGQYEASARTSSDYTHHWEIKGYCA